MPFVASSFAASFSTTFSTMLILFLISFFGWLCVRRGFVKTDAVDGLTRVLVDVITPAKLIVVMTASLNAETLRACLLVILLLIIFPGLGFIFGLLTTRAWKAKKQNRDTDRSIIVMTLINNGVFLPLPIILAIVPPEQRNLAALYMAAAYMTLVVIQWTIGASLLSKAGSGHQTLWQKIRPMINLPVISILAGAILSLFPEAVAAANDEEASSLLVIPMRAFEMLGSALSPVAMLVLGMMIAQCRLGSSLTLRAVSIPGGFRLIIAPAMMLIVILVLGIHRANVILAQVLMVQAAMPPATVLPIIARRFGGDWETISSVLLVTYLASLVTVPFWMGFF